MPLRSWPVAGVFAACALAGCGGTSNKATTSSTAAVSSAAQAPPSTTHLPPGAPSALRGVFGRVLVAGELPGFNPQGRRILGINAASWVVADEYPPSQRAREAARLRSLGFVVAVRERLAPTNGGKSEAISVVQQFRTPSAARADLAFETRPIGNETTFAVATIPGARGFGGSSSEGSGQNVAFTKGPYFYLVGVGAPSGASLLSRATLLAAALHLYDHVHA
jgi:hypothetical protein